MNCPTGEVAGNLTRHLAYLEQANSAACSIAVFPEMSLTGYIDPRKDRGTPLAIDAAPVRELARATATTGVAALFGFVERNGDAPPFVTQVFARDGRIAAVYRKVWIEGDEEGLFAAGGEPGAFELGAVRYGIAVCADMNHPEPFDAAGGDGAAVMFCCAAPGLYGRRTDEAGWRDGFEWWRGSTLERLPEYARRNRLWLAIATQAGPTQDEDFPGWAAVIDPSGELIAELPDWREGTLVARLGISPLGQS
jgi:predicted amidohydrolase